ncbi:MAG: type II toxin-antitoxin system Phd/YefM family antitoxin [Acidimicrobiales bacterium]
MSATDAARNFSDLLDAVEHGGDRYTIVRRGRPVAELAPTGTGSGRDVKSVLRRHQRDQHWAAEVRSTRALLLVDER